MEIDYSLTVAASKDDAVKIAERLSKENPGMTVKEYLDKQGKKEITLN